MEKGEQTEEDRSGECGEGDKEHNAITTYV